MGDVMKQDIFIDWHVSCFTCDYEKNRSYN